MHYNLANASLNKKPLCIDIGALKEIIFNKAIESITWIKSAQQIADSLTKHGAN